MGRVAYLFPGQGSQELGMGRGFAAAVPESAAVFEEADAALGFALSRLVDDGPAETLALTEHTQPAVLTASIAALRAARAAGLAAPEFVAGHSLGEYAALVAADVLSFADAVRAVRSRGRFMQEAVPAGEGGMAAVLALSLAEVRLACADACAELPGRVVAPANVNGPDQVVIAGHRDALARAAEKAKARGARRVIPLDVSAPFHSPLMAPVQPRLANILELLSFRDATVPVVTNVEALPEVSGARLRQLLVEQVTAPVRWSDVVARLVAEGCDTFVELGPGAVLAGLVKRLAPGARILSIGQPRDLDVARLALAA